MHSQKLLNLKRYWIDYNSLIQHQLNLQAGQRNTTKALL